MIHVNNSNWLKNEQFSVAVSFPQKLAALGAHNSMIDRAFLLPSISPSQAARKVIPTCYQQ
jgi:hypothetical protein